MNLDTQICSLKNKAGKKRNSIVDRKMSFLYSKIRNQTLKSKLLSHHRFSLFKDVFKQDSAQESCMEYKVSYFFVTDCFSCPRCDTERAQHALKNIENEKYLKFVQNFAPLQSNFLHETLHVVHFSSHYYHHY